MIREVKDVYKRQAITTAAAPYCLIIRACSRNLSSPSFREIELTIDFPDVYKRQVLAFEFYFSNHSFFPPYIIRDVDQYV